MAKDKLKIYLGDRVSINALNLSKKDLYMLRRCNHWSHPIEKYYLKYSLLPNSDKYGYLTIDTSISKLLNGDNAIPSTQTDIDEIAERICSDLGHILNFNNIPNFEEWTVSADETFIDIIVSKEVAESIYHIIEHARIAYRNVDVTYKENGSIYIHSGKNRKKANWTLILYDKVKEGASRGCDISNIKDLKEGQMCLRLELKTKLKMLRNIVKQYIESKENPIINELPTSFNPRKFDYNLLDNQVYFSPLETPKKSKSNYLSCRNLQCINVNLMNKIDFYNMVEKLSSLITNKLNSNNYTKPTLSDVLSSKFQGTILKKMLKDLHLFDKDIQILTEKKLLSFIKKSNMFKTKTMKLNAKKAIKILNGKTLKYNLCTKTLNDYRKQLLNAGVHFLYTKYPIPEISQAMLDKAIYETGNLVIE